LHCSAGTQDSVITKRITRVVDIDDTTGSDHEKLRNEDGDSLMSEKLLLTKFFVHDLKVYAEKDMTFIQPLSRNQIADLLVDEPDTTEIDDPVTGNKMIKIIRRDLNFRDFTRFKVLEEWTFYMRTGHTSIKIIALEPVRQLYNGRGLFKGYKGSFWFKYDDVQDVVKRYEKEHPSKNLPLAIWEDYFSEENK